MRLNKRGYMLVEIVLASVLAMGIAYYLLNLTYQFKNTDQDLYQSIIYLSDKNLITRNIMDDIDGGTISGLTYSSSYVQFSLTKDSITETRRLSVTTSPVSVIKYGKYTASGYNTQDVSYYEKKLDNSVVVGTINVTISSKNSANIRIPVSSIYEDENYDIKLFLSKVV